jgi:hypothetical protein
VEIYDRDAADPTSRLINLSALGFAGTGANALAAGFVIDGTAPKRLLVRAVGPGLREFGLKDTLPDPRIALVPAGQSGAVVANDDWDGSSGMALAFRQAGAFELAPGSRDAALTVQLPPGAYTILATDGTGVTGNILLELYDLDP